MNIKALIKKISKEFPEARATRGDEWSDGYEFAIWFKGSEDHTADGGIIFDEFGQPETMGVHPKLYEIVNAAGWYCEPYDAGTLFAFEDGI